MNESDEKSDSFCSEAYQLYRSQKKDDSLERLREDIRERRAMLRHT